jgi:predicted enzyme related to lactoylglutathione lyase
MPGFNGIGWFEIGTDDPAGAEKFYGDVFGWTVGHDDGDGPGFQMITAGDGPGLHAGGLVDTGGAPPGYAVFGVLVADVAETCRRVQAAGGSVQRAPQVTPGGIAFAHLLDPAGNQFEVFTMPPGRG